MPQEFEIFKRELKELEDRLEFMRRRERMNNFIIRDLTEDVNVNNYKTGVLTKSLSKNTLGVKIFYKYILYFICIFTVKQHKNLFNY